MIKCIDRFLDEHFANSYRLHIRCGDLILYKKLTLYVEDIICDTEFLCSTLGKTGTGKIANSEQQYKFVSIEPIKDKTFKWWACWVAK